MRRHIVALAACAALSTAAMSTGALAQGNGEGNGEHGSGQSFHFGGNFGSDQFTGGAKWHGDRFSGRGQWGNGPNAGGFYAYGGPYNYHFCISPDNYAYACGPSAPGK
jgi:hypothetical protein